jgi:hypothetical protein
VFGITDVYACELIYESQKPSKGLLTQLSSITNWGKEGKKGKKGKKEKKERKER